MLPKCYGTWFGDDTLSLHGLCQGAKIKCIMHTFYPLSLGHIANLIFVFLLLALLWLTFKKNRLSASVVLVLYVAILALRHFINQSDSKYSDISHGLFGSWNIPLLGICLLLVLAIQFYVISINYKIRMAIK